MLPTGRHSDYGFWPLTLIPRSLTSFEWGPPRMLFGNSELTADANGLLYPKPIPKRGQWWIGGPVYRGWIIPISFAMTTKAGWHTRFIARWDDLGFYWSMPTFTVKKVA